MTTNQSGVTEENAAWISVDLPLAASELFDSLRNVERLLRLNPYLEILSWREPVPGPLSAGKRFQAETLNEVNGLRQDRTLIVADFIEGRGYTLRYDNGLKQSTIIGVEELTPHTSRLTIKDCYPDRLAQEEIDTRLIEVDKSLIPWGDAIRRYYVSRKAWGWLPLYGYLQNGPWLKMPPRHRRIARMIIWVSVLEFVVFLFVFLIYWLEMGRT